MQQGQLNPQLFNLCKDQTWPCKLIKHKFTETCHFAHAISKASKPLKTYRKKYFCKLRKEIKSLEMPMFPHYYFKTCVIIVNHYRLDYNALFLYN